MGTKIQINSLEALNRLIGGDTEAEIEIRNSVVQEFAKTKLKPLLNSPLITSTIKEIESAVIQEARKRFSEGVAIFKTSSYNYLYDAQLLPEIKTLIQDCIKNSLEKSVAEKSEEILAKLLTDRSIEERITKRVNYLTEEKINELVKAKIEAAFKNVKV